MISGACRPPRILGLYIGRYLRRSGRLAPDAADDLQAVETEESVAARLLTTLQDQNDPRRTVKLANSRARL